MNNMWCIVKAEQLKLKHTFGKYITIIMPVLTLLLALYFTGGIQKAFPAAAWNWWYVILLPGMIAIFSWFNIKKDKKLKYYHILTIDILPKKSWIGKIIYISLAMLMANIIIFLGTLTGGAVFGTTISLIEGFDGAFVLTVSYLWEVPLCLFLSARFGMFVSIFSSMALSAIGVGGLADGNLWWTFLPAIPIRLMCSILGILPNGLLVQKGDTLSNPNVIVLGIILSIIWFFVLTICTTIWFQRMGEKE